MYSVLLVDDDPEILDAWRLILEHDGYKVRCASNGVEALAHLENEMVDLIVTDWMMPTMGGAELCARLKTLPEFAKVPILVHTSAPQPDYVEPTKWEAYLRKPVRSELFLATVAGLCQKIR